MKNRMMKYVSVIAITMMAGINVFNAQKTEGLSDLALANVEALAINEWIPEKGWECFQNLYDDTSQDFFFVVIYCGDCGSHSATQVDKTGYCRLGGEL